MSKWIKITKKLPPLNKRVWCVAKDSRLNKIRQFEAARVDLSEHFGLRKTRKSVD